MPHIPNAYTDSAPASAELGGTLYIAFKGHDSDHIYLASTKNPADASSWRIVDTSGIKASPTSPKAEPAQIRTSHGPGLTSTDNYLWLTFKGHNNPYIWQVALREPSAGTWEMLRFGCLEHAQTTQGPATAGPTMEQISTSGPLPKPPMVLYRGNRDDRVWIHDYRPRTDSDVHLAGSNTEFSPAVAYADLLGREARFVAYTDGATQQVIFTRHYRPEQPGAQPGWSQAAPVPYAFTSSRPALAVHDGGVFLARKSRSANEHQITISSWDNFWVTHGSMPRTITTDQGPALVSFGHVLYVVFKGHPGSRVGYFESHASRSHVRTTIVVSLSGASASTSWDFHRVVQECATAHGYPLTSGVNWSQDKGDTIAGNGDADRIKDTINTLASRNGGDKSRLSLLVAGKSAGGVLAWNTFKRNFGSHIAAFHRVALVMVDPHGSVWEDDRVGTYSDDQNLWWPGNWPSDRGVFRVYNIYQHKEGLTGANFPDSRVYRNIRLSEGNIDHDNIIFHDRTCGLITEALSFALSGA